jgi:hypothetical protein
MHCDISVEAIHGALPRLRHHNVVSDGGIILIAILHASNVIDVPRDGAGVQIIVPAPTQKQISPIILNLQFLMYLLVEINIVQMTLGATLIDPIGVVRKPCPGVARKAGKAAKLKHRQHDCLFTVMMCFFWLKWF